MGQRLPRITGAEAVRALERAGWFRDHQRGSHVYLRHAEKPGKRVTVAIHAGETIKLKTLQTIIEQAGLSVEEFRALL
jgi:predicted RNA binding protein YcfA (HicA-like mRNA interferase family)